MYSMLFGNNSGGGANALLDGAPFYLELTHTAIPTRGSITPTFTRATTETGQKWDEAGYLDFTALAGEVVFKGARRERNLVNTTSEVFTNAAWTKVLSTVTAGFDDPDGGTGAYRLLSTGASGYLEQSIAAGTLPIANTAMMAWYIKSNTAASQTVKFARNATITTKTVTTSWQRLSHVTTSAGGTNFYLQDNGGNNLDVLIYRAAIYDITGETDQTTIRPYVSVGVPADWAGDEGVSNPGPDFTVSTGWSTGAGNTITVVDGDIKDYTTVADGPFCGIGFSVVNGTKYVVNTTVASDGTSVAARTHLGTSVGNADIYTHTAGYIFGQTTFEYTATSTGMIYVWFYGVTRVTDKYILIDSLTIKPAAYHGSMVDGVKCYDTDRSGNPISTSGSYPLVGYVPWEARTNLGLQSNAFTTTWTDSVSSAAPTQNSIGPDGATSAWTLTDASAIASSYVSQDVVLTAATYTRSIFVKKTVGAQASYPVLLSYLAATTGLAGVTIDTTNGIATAWTAYTGFTGVNGTASCVSHNDDFWRVSLTFTGTAAAWTHRMYPAGTANATLSTGTLDMTAQGSAVFYGAMVNLGAFAGPYQPTTTVAVARNASVLTYTGADVANIKTLAATFSRGVGVSNVGVMVQPSDGTLNNRTIMYLGSATEMDFSGTVAGVAEWFRTASNAYTPGTESKVAQSYATNDVKMDKDGTAQTADTLATVPVVTQLHIGHAAGSFQLNGPVNHIYGWTRNLSQSELGAVDR